MKKRITATIKRERIQFEVYDLMEKMSTEDKVTMWNHYHMAHNCDGLVIFTNEMFDDILNKYKPSEIIEMCEDGSVSLELPWFWFYYGDKVLVSLSDQDIDELFEENQCELCVMAVDEHDTEQGNFWIPEVIKQYFRDIYEKE